MNKQATGVNQERDSFKKKEYKAQLYEIAYQESLSLSDDNPYSFMGFYLPLIAFAVFLIFILWYRFREESSAALSVAFVILDIALPTLWVAFYPYLKARIYATWYAHKSIRQYDNRNRQQHA